MKYFVIAELGINHLGSVSTAKQMIDAAEEAGVDAVKLQYYVWDDIREEFNNVLTIPNTNTINPLVQQVKNSQLSLDRLGELRDYAHSRGLGWVCTAFKKPRRFSELSDLKPDAIKIRYSDFTIHLALFAVNLKIPLILASCPAPPIENMVLYYNPRCRWLYCIPKYPPSPEDFDAARSTGFHGFSDHYPHNTASLVAAALTRGNEYIIEKHVMLDTNEGTPPQNKVPDFSVSITFKQLAELVEHLRLMEKLRPGDLYFPRPPRTGR